ncbi:hypothetical protein SB822_59885, partial [Paraburkholderia sp. SIMBA_054]
AALEARHDALRLRFVKEAGEWKQIAVTEATKDSQTAIVRHEKLSSLADLAAACNNIQSSLDIERGPIWRVGHFETQDETRL